MRLRASRRWTGSGSFVVFCQGVETISRSVTVSFEHVLRGVEIRGMRGDGSLEVTRFERTLVFQNSTVFFTYRMYTADVARMITKDSKRCDIEWFMYCLATCVEPAIRRYWKVSSLTWGNGIKIRLERCWTYTLTIPVSGSRSEVYVGAKLLEKVDARRMTEVLGRGAWEFVASEPVSAAVR
jgi:hypothetical protein